MPHPKTLPPQNYLRQCFDYDPDSGKLRWKARPRHLGYLSSIDDAVAAYEAAARSLHGQFFRPQPW